MPDPFLRLLWALPLVLTLGVVAILVLKRRLGPSSSAAKTRERARMRVLDELVLPDESRLFLVDIAGSTHVVVSSSRQVALHPLGVDDVASRLASRRAPWFISLAKGVAK